MITEKMMTRVLVWFFLLLAIAACNRLPGGFVLTIGVCGTLSTLGAVKMIKDFLEIGQQRGVTKKSWWYWRIVPCELTYALALSMSIGLILQAALKMSLGPTLLLVGMIMGLTLTFDIYDWIQKVWPETLNNIEAYKLIQQENTHHES
ncbi:MAG: hypothetical protein WCX71_04875 [Candidatus Buchananbacteria bacterium]